MHLSLIKTRGRAKRDLHSLWIGEERVAIISPINARKSDHLLYGRFIAGDSQRRMPFLFTGNRMNFRERLHRADDKSLMHAPRRLYVSSRITTLAKIPPLISRVTFRICASQYSPEKNGRWSCDVTFNYFRIPFMVYLTFFIAKKKFSHLLYYYIKVDPYK